jgi:predicted DNA-binding transcriptional regulator YafY
MPSDIVWFTYVNHSGETAERKVRPKRIWFGSTEWHPEPQWLLEAVDLGKDGLRDFAMAAVSNWRSVEEPSDPPA